MADDTDLFAELFGADDDQNATPMPPDTPEPWTPQIYELSGASADSEPETEPERPPKRRDRIPGVIPGLEYLFDGTARRRKRQAEDQRRRDSMAREAEAVRIALHHTGARDVVYEESVNPYPHSATWRDVVREMPRVQRIDKPLEPFRIRDGAPFTKHTGLAMVQAVAKNIEKWPLIEERKQKIVDMMNACFCKLNTGGVPHVGAIMPSSDNAMKGRMVLAQFPAAGWVAANTWQVLFTVNTPGAYSKEDEKAMQALFGRAVVSSTNKREVRTARGWVPPKKKQRRRGKESDSEEEIDNVEGRHLQGVWDAHLPARVKEGRSAKQVHVRLAQMWYESSNARAYYGTYFRPLLDDPNPCYKLNLFEGWTWTAEEVRGDRDRNRDAVEVWCQHVEEVMANGNVEYASWLHYFAWHLLMQPAEPWEGVPVLTGPQGLRQEQLVPVLEGIIGQQMTMVTASMDDVVGNFTDRLENKMLVLLDEAKRDNGANIGSYMKVLVTDLQFRLRKMYQPVTFADKYFRIVVFSNYEDVLEVEPGERRYFMNRCSAKYKGDTAYHARFHEALPLGRGHAGHLRLVRARVRWLGVAQRCSSRAGGWCGQNY
jgi:hypothetical protein